MSHHKKSALMLGAALFAAHTFAQGETFRVQPASGHPLDNLARSNFDIFDQMVTNHSSTARTWLTHFQRPSGPWYFYPANITAYVNASNGSRHRLCRFHTTWLGCTSWVTAGSTNTAVTAAYPLHEHNVHLQSSLKSGEALRAVLFEYIVN